MSFVLEAAEVSLNVILPIFLVVGVAAAFSRHQQPDTKMLSGMVIYLFNPCLVVDSLIKTNISGEKIGKIVLLVVVLHLIMMGVGWTVSKGLKFSRSRESAFMLSVMLINAANYGIPFNEFAFGQDARQIAVIFWLATMMVNYTLGVYVASRGNVSTPQALRNIVTIPTGYAMVVGFTLNLADMNLPLPIMRAVSLLADGAIPVMLVMLGFQVSHLSLRGNPKPMLLAACLRLFIGPLVGLILVTLLQLEGLTRNVILVESAMPTAVIAGVLATEFGSDSEFTASVILLSTVASVVTLSFLAAIL